MDVVKIRNDNYTQENKSFAQHIKVPFSCFKDQNVVLTLYHDNDTSLIHVTSNELYIGECIY